VGEEKSNVTISSYVKRGECCFFLVSYVSITFIYIYKFKFKILVLFLNFYF
jgi:hypothetical protein